MKKSTIMTGYSCWSWRSLSAPSLPKAATTSSRRPWPRSAARATSKKPSPSIRRSSTETKDESLAAKAQLRIGICYEKLGSQEARKAYQRLIADYPGQKEEVALARDRLARLADDR